MSHTRFTTRVTIALVAMAVTVGWAGAATAVAQTQTDDDFSGGTHANTEVVAPDDLALSPVVDIVEEFDGDALPSGWESFVWPPGGGSATVASGMLTVDGARANTIASYEGGRSLDFAATFSGAQFQHVGFGQTLGTDAEQWAIFSTGSAGGQLFARTNPGGASFDTAIPGVDVTVEHDYSIEWTPTEVRYFVDGNLVATHAIPITAQMRPIASDAAQGGGDVDVEYVDLYSYPLSGTFTSRVFDSGDSRATWRSLTPALDTPSGTAVTFEVRTGGTPSPDASWTAFQAVDPGGEIAGPLGRRYLQYRATLTTSDTSITPFVESVTLEYEVDTTAPVTTIDGLTVSGTTARVTFSSEAGARFECNLDTGPFVACTSPREYTGLSAGSHRVRVRAIDQVGNIGPAAERTFTIAAPLPPPPPPPSPDNKAPKVRPKPRSVFVTPQGRFAVRLTCPRDEASCRIVLRVRYRGRTAAFKRVTVDGGETERVTLRLRRYARRALVVKRRLRPLALTTARDAAGNRATTRTRMTLKARRIRR